MQYQEINEILLDYKVKCTKTERKIQKINENIN